MTQQPESMVSSPSTHHLESWSPNKGVVTSVRSNYKRVMTYPLLHCDVMTQVPESILCNPLSHTRALTSSHYHSVARGVVGM